MSFQHIIIHSLQTFKANDTAVKKLNKELEEETEKVKAAQSRCRGYYWRRYGGFKMMSTSLDNRPKKILVAGYTPDEKDKVLAHFIVNI